MVLQIFQLSAQKSEIKFSSLNQVGLLSGGRGEAWMLQTINGIKKDRWFAGAGAGLDFYNERTIPLFFDLRRELNNRKNTPFVYADAGANFSWLSSIQREQKQFPTSSPGLFYDFGAGWKLSGKNNRGFIVSAGYSFKQVKEKVKSFWWITTPETPFEPVSEQRYNYLYRRIVIKAGFVL